MDVHYKIPMLYLPFKNVDTKKREHNDALQKGLYLWRKTVLKWYSMKQVEKRVRFYKIVY